MLLIIAFLLQGAFSIQFTFSLKSNELKGFGENIGQNSLIVDNILQYSHSLKLQKFSFTTQNTQLNYQFCVHNLANSWMIFNFTLVTEMDAQDFCCWHKKKIQSLQKFIQKLNGLVDQIEPDQKEIEERQSIRFQTVSKISYIIILFILITLFLMMLTKFYQLEYQNNFSKTKTQLIYLQIFKQLFKQEFLQQAFLNQS
ncbi:unnamed protein product [Paramecium primaurelia]|uniref:GOLD domain-containing protein n=1 Tax=Paramecium primaurelia TaxID=5886 RepID=A0A8S1JVB6_PARPR|nr:unnamed protein product [Paramecium primaurelia]